MRLAPRELYDRPATRFTAAFVGASNRRQSAIQGLPGNSTVRWGATDLMVCNEERLPAGTTITASWRPEAGAIGDPLAAGGNTLRGRIELMTFLGPMTRLDIRIDGDPEPVLVDLASSSTVDLAPGQAIAVSVPPREIRLYPYP